MFTITCDGWTLSNFAVTRDHEGSGKWKLTWTRTKGAKTINCARKFPVSFTVDGRNLTGQDLADLVENIIGRKLTPAESSQLLETVSLTS